MTTERLQKMMAAACFGKTAPFESDLPRFLASFGLEREDVEAILAAPRSRLGVYRRLIRHNVTGVIETMLEQTRRRLEACAPGAFEQAIVTFLDEEGPHTPHLRDVPAEFLAFIAPRWRARADARLPRWLVDYAELELVDFTIGVAPRPAPPPPLGDVTADRPLVFAEPRRIVTLAWAVNEMPADDLAFEPTERPIAILVYRDADHRSRFLELTPLAAAILERLFAGDTLGQAMVSACQSSGHPLDDTVLGGAARLLADLGERGVLLGAKAT